MKRKIQLRRPKPGEQPYTLTAPDGWTYLLVGLGIEIRASKLRVYENGVSGYVDGRPAVARFDWGRGCGVRGTWLRRGLLPGASGSIL